MLIINTLDLNVLLSALDTENREYKEKNGVPATETHTGLFEGSLVCIKCSKKCTKMRWAYLGGSTWAIHYIESPEEKQQADENGVL